MTQVSSFTLPSRKTQQINCLCKDVPWHCTSLCTVAICTQNIGCARALAPSLHPREHYHSNATSWLYLKLSPKCSAWCFWRDICSSHAYSLLPPAWRNAVAASSPQLRVRKPFSLPWRGQMLSTTASARVSSTCCMQEGGHYHEAALIGVVILSWAKASVNSSNFWQVFLAGRMSEEPLSARATVPYAARGAISVSTTVLT